MDGLHLNFPWGQNPGRGRDQDHKDLVAAYHSSPRKFRRKKAQGLSLGLISWGVKRLVCTELEVQLGARNEEVVIVVADVGSEDVDGSTTDGGEGAD